ncbi:MAG TPA: TonB-dependent receptor plug domain-containing protein, partial [Pyrinomonadaceae bacterium]|nr:TonB-dependent receptor plug domain-containing protein [Pyrinomonadaceae bacterium]
MKQTFVYVFLSLAYLIFSYDVEAQIGSGASGRVLDGNGAVVAGASVRITSNDVRFERTGVTDGEGRYVFSEIAKGSYTLNVSARGFEELTRTIRMPGDSNTDLILQPSPIAAELSITSGLIAGTAESLREIPGSVERITAQQLENARVRDFSEALRKVSGIIVRDEEGFGLRPNIGIRGTNPTRSTKVLLLEDGLPLSYAPYGDNASYYHPPVERYESIEVLKGSGQIAYGPQTVAGVINYLTPNPPQEPTLNLKFEGGNKQFFNGAAGFGATFGKLGFLTNFSHKQGDGARQNTNFKLYDLSSKATYALNSRNALTAKFTSFREDSNLTYTGATEAEYAADPRGNIFKNDFFYGRRYGFSLHHAAVLTSKINFTTNFYSNYFSRDWWRQTSNSNERPFRLRRANDTNVPPISDPDCLSLADLNTTCGNRGNLRDYFTMGIEPRLNANFDIGAVRNELNIGFRVHREDQDRLGKYGDLPTSRDGVLSEDNERKALAYSGFIQNRFIWSDFAFTPGIRLERIEYERTNRMANGGVGVTGKTTITEVIP